VFFLIITLGPGELSTAGIGSGFDPDLIELIMDAGCVITAIDVDMVALRRIAQARLAEYERFK
jgi:hypothetical protein